MVYEAYGLAIASDIDFPELVTLQDGDSENCDVCYRAVSSLPTPTVGITQGEFIDLDTTPAILYLANRGRFHISGGTLVEFDAEPQDHARTLRLFLLGPALSLILHQRNYLVLHASGVCLPDGTGKPVAVAFLGDSGEGKSTMGATLYERGHRAVADDIIPVPDPLREQDSATPPLVPPGFPMFKLWPESMEALDQPKHETPLLVPDLPEYPRWEKQANREFETAPVPLGAVFVLTSGPELSCERLSPHASIMALVKNSYWIAELPPDQRERHFQQCFALAKRVPVFQLQRPRDLARLGEVAELVESTVRNLTADVPIGSDSGSHKG